MFNKKNKITKLKILLSIFIVFGISTTVYIFTPKNKNKTEKTKTFKFSHPDNRPNKIKGKTVTLKRLQPAYFKKYFKKINYPKILKPLYFPSKLTFHWIKEYLDEEFDREKNDKTFLYLIFNNKNNELIGSIEIREPNPEDPGQFGCWLTPKYWNKGKLQEAFSLLSNAYFKLKPNVKKFNAHVEMWNLRSYYALKKCGFKLIKTLHFKNHPSRYLLEYYNKNLKSGETMNKKILFILMPKDYRDEEFYEPYNILKENGFKIDVASTKKGVAVGASGYKFEPNLILNKIKNFDNYDALVIPGGPGSIKYLWNNNQIQSIIKQFHNSNKIVAAICYAVIPVVQSGILKNEKATVYPTKEARNILEKNKVKFVLDGIVVLNDKKIITGQGPKFAKEFGEQIAILLNK